MTTKNSATHYIGRYKVISLLGKGGMGLVYKVQNNRGEFFALKMVFDQVVFSEASFARFKREIEIISKISHPNIVKIREIGRFGVKPYYVMDYLEGITLKQYIESKRKLQEKDAVRIIKAIANATKFLHEHGVVHRDIKPSNIILVNKKPYLMDFGIACYIENEDGITNTGESMGSPNYMPLEQAKGYKKKIGTWSDVYAIGTTLYHMLTGITPFHGKSTFDILINLDTKTLTPIKKINKKISKKLEKVVTKASQKNFRNRYQTIDEFLADLNDIKIQRNTSYREKKSYSKVGIFLLLLSVIVFTGYYFLKIKSKNNKNNYKHGKINGKKIDKNTPKKSTMKKGIKKNILVIEDYIKKIDKNNKEQLQSSRELLILEYKKLLKLSYDSGVETILKNILMLYKKNEKIQQRINDLKRYPKYPQPTKRYLQNPDDLFELIYLMYKTNQIIHAYYYADLYISCFPKHKGIEFIKDLRGKIYFTLEKRQNIYNELATTLGYQRNKKLSKRSRRLTQFMQHLGYLNVARWNTKLPFVREKQKQFFLISDYFEELTPFITSLKILLFIKDQNMGEAKLLLADAKSQKFGQSKKTKFPQLSHYYYDPRSQYFGQQVWPETLYACAIFYFSTGNNTTFTRLYATLKRDFQIYPGKLWKHIENKLIKTKVQYSDERFKNRLIYSLLNGLVESLVLRGMENQRGLRGPQSFFLFTLLFEILANVEHTHHLCYLHAGNFYYRYFLYQRQHPRAYAFLKKARSLFQKSSLIHRFESPIYYLGLINYREGLLQKAKKQFLSVVEKAKTVERTGKRAYLYPVKIDSIFHLAKIYHKEKRLALAKKKCEYLWDILGKHRGIFIGKEIEILSLLALISKDKGELKQSINYYKKIVKNVKKFRKKSFFSIQYEFLALYSIAEGYFSLRMYKASRKTFRKLLQRIEGSKYSHTYRNIKKRIKEYLRKLEKHIPK